MTPALRRSAGFSLLETVLSIALMAVSVTIAFGAVGSALPKAFQSEQPVSAVQLARDLIEEVLSKPFDDPDAVDGEALGSGGVRSAWDDMDDYDGFSDSPPRDPEGNPIAGAGSYARRVVITPCTGSTGTVPFPASTRALATFLRVDVYVSRAGVDLVRLSAAKANPATIIPSPRSGLVYVDGTRVNSAVGGGGTLESVAFDLQNRTGAGVQVSAVRVSWAPADATFYRTFRITYNGVPVELGASGNYFAANDLVTLPTAVTIGGGGTAHVEIQHFRDNQAGTGAAHSVTALAFTLMWTSGTRTYQTDIRVGG